MKRKTEKNRGKRRGEAGGKKKKEKSQLTLGQYVGPTNS